MPITQRCHSYHTHGCAQISLKHKVEYFDIGNN